MSEPQEDEGAAQIDVDNVFQVAVKSVMSASFYSRGR